MRSCDCLQGSGIVSTVSYIHLDVYKRQLLDGAARAGQNLLDAAAIQNLSYDTGTGALSFRIQNQTGHKLISGYPEGRRMFVTIRVLDAAQNVLYEVNPYDSTVSTLLSLIHI